MHLTEKDLPRAFRSSKAFIVGGAVTVGSLEQDCRCGHFDTPDKFGYCRTDDCRRDRLILALLAGHAKKLPDGSLIWDIR